MYQQDYILNEARKFAALLARLLGLKTEGNMEAFKFELDNILQSEYDTLLEELLALNADEFKTEMQSPRYSAEKLNALGQMLYMLAHPFANDDETGLILEKVLTIFDVLEQRYHYQSFQNIENRNNIYRYLNNHAQLNLEAPIIPLHS